MAAGVRRLPGPEENRHGKSADTRMKNLRYENVRKISRKRENARVKIEWKRLRESSAESAQANVVGD